MSSLHKAAARAVLGAVFTASALSALTSLPAAAPPPTRGSLARRVAPPVAVAGMSLEIKAGRVVVGAVQPGSPAATAGVLPGDALLVVEGTSLVDLDLISPEAVLGIFDAPGREFVRLVLGRGTGTLGLMLPLRAPDRPPGALYAPEPPQVGARAPIFEAHDLQGAAVALASLRGGAVLLEFWASWCPPCREQTLTLRRLAAQYPRGLAIVGVSLDEDRREYEAFIYNHHLPGRQIFDGGPQGPIGLLYAVPSAGVPYSVLIDPNGRIVAMGTSLLEKEDAIARLAAEARQRGEAR